MAFNASLLNAPKLQAIVDIANEIAGNCQAITDALCDYENAADLSGSDRTEARDEAREAAWAALGELLADAGRLRAERDKLDETLA